MSNNETSVVLGAGPLGLSVMRKLAAQGGKVRVVSRSGASEVSSGVEVMRADLSQTAEVRRACAGASVVYLCAKPPYSQWAEKFPPLMQALIAAVPAEQARIVYTDNLYAYGPVDGVLTEQLPHDARGRKGLTRARMVDDLLAAHRAGHVRATVARCSDFFGPGVIEAAMGERVFAAAQRGRPAEVLGNVDAPHTQAFIDDVAAGLLVLAERDEALGQVWHLPSAETLSTRAFLKLVYEEAGQPIKLRIAPRIFVSVMGLFNTQMRELKEVLYTYEQPFVVSHEKFERAFGRLSTTPHREAIRETLAWFARRASAVEDRVLGRARSDAV